MAYGRTFIQLINDVLRELREDEVSDWNQTAYSTLVAGWINSVKRDVEAAWAWRDRRSDVTVTTSAGTSVYELTGTNSRTHILDAWNDTKGYELSHRTSWGSRRVRYGSTVDVSGSPTDYTVEAVHSTNGTLQVRLYPTPDAAETLIFHCYIPQDDLAANDDVLYIPHTPVVDGAVARARYERGDDGGVSFADQAAFMRAKLASHIALDANRQPEELVWEPI